MEIKLILRDQSVIKFKESQNKLATDFVNQIKFIFQIEGDWQGKELVAQFSQKVCSTDKQAPKQIEKSMPVENGSVLLPKEFAQYPGILFVSVFGKIAGEVTTFTSIPTEYQIVPSGFISNAEEPIPPTPNLYDELLSNLRQTELNVNQKAEEVAQSAEKVEEAEAAAVAAEESAQKANKAVDDLIAAKEAGEFDGKDGTDISQLPIKEEITENEMIIVDSAKVGYQIFESLFCTRVKRCSDEILDIINESEVLK